MLLPPLLLLLLGLLLPSPALLTPPTSTELQVRGERVPRDAKQDSIKVVISEGCATPGDSSDANQGGKELDLVPGSPLVLTHRIKLVPSASGSGSGSGSCGCEGDLATLRERVENLEREVSALRERCGGPEGNCCTSKESKGAGCSIKPEPGECPNECSDQGRCVDGRCVCFPGFSGPDCSDSNCPGNCNDRGRCVNGQCLCDPGSAGPDCSQTSCPDNCSARGRCVGGRCVCDAGFSGPSCSDESCPGNCNNRGRCVNGQCVCDEGFDGADCSEAACPGNCNGRGRCINGKCVCDAGFTGKDCSANSCPGNCNSRGRCVNGRCVCKEGFTGPDCSEVACPGNCNNRGRCVNGRCVCESRFTGPDCSAKACPGNCNDRGKCVNGKCVCDSGFTGADCSENSCPGNCNNRGRCVNGRCVCDEGFVGDDCAEQSCPGNCNNRGRCVNGECVCDSGYNGEDCSDIACPGNCNNRGRCVNGQCVCDEGFTGPDCSEAACPGNCNNRGRCVNGRCVCKEAFTGDDCSEKACPNNCSNRGKCVNGKCVCEVGFTGPDCSAKGCPNNCNSRGRCVKGSCVCRRGFTGPDCSQCQDGRTGANCDTVMSGVSQLTTQDITETSATLVWTQPAVQYDKYHITFSSQKESDQLIPVTVEGSRTSFTQTGLAAGQEYSATIVGEVDGRRGAESSTQFTTLISGPSNLQVVKTSTSSAVVQWEESQGVIDRYILTVTPSDGEGRSQEITIPFGQNSAHIRQLEAGRLYDVVLVAERGESRSKPANTQALPGMMFSRVTSAALTLQVTQAPGVDRHMNPQPAVQAFDQQGRNREGEDSERVGGDGEVSLRTETPLGRLEVPGRPPMSRFTSIRGGPQKQGPQRREPAEPDRSEPGVLEPSTSASSPEHLHDGESVLLPETDSETNRQSRSEGPTGPKEHPDVGMAGRGNDTDPTAAEPTPAAQSQKKKCLNKITVTHLRLPLKDRGSSRWRAGSGPAGNALSSGTDAPPPGDLDGSPDLFDKLLQDTYKSLNVTTFSVHMSKASKLSSDEEIKREQIIGNLKPLSPFSLESSSSESTESESTVALSSSPPPSQTPSTTDTPDSPQNNKLDAKDSASVIDKKQSSTSSGGISHFQNTKRGFVRRPHANVGSYQNRTRQNTRVPQRMPPRLNPVTQHEDPTPPPTSEQPPADKLVVEGKEMTGVVPNRDNTLTEKERIPVRRFPLKGGYRRNPSPNAGPFRNRTRPDSRPFARPSQPASPVKETHEGSLSVASSPTVSHYSSSNTGPKKGGNEGTISSRILTEFNQTLSGKGTPSSNQPFNKVFFRRPQPNGGPFSNRTNLRYPHRGPIRGPIRKMVPTRKLNEGSRIGAGEPMRPPGTDAIPQNHPGEQDVLRLTEQVQIHQSEEKDPAAATTSNTERDGHVLRPQTKESETKEIQEIMTDTIQGSQTLGQRDPGTSRPATPRKRQPLTTVGEHHTQKDLPHSTSQTHTDRSTGEGNIYTNTDFQKGSDDAGSTIIGRQTKEQLHSIVSTPVEPLTNKLGQMEREETLTTDTDVQEKNTSVQKQDNLRAFEPLTRPPVSKTTRGDQQTDNHGTIVRPENNELSPSSKETITKKGASDGETTSFTVQGYNPTRVTAEEHLQLDHARVRSEVGAVDTEGNEETIPTSTHFQNRSTGLPVRRRPIPKQPSSRPFRPVNPPKRQPPAGPGIGDHHTHIDGPETRPEANTLDTGAIDKTATSSNVNAGQTRGRLAFERPGMRPSRPATPSKRIPPPRTRTDERYAQTSSLQTRVTPESSSSDSGGNTESTTGESEAGNTGSIIQGRPTRKPTSPRPSKPFTPSKTQPATRPSAGKDKTNQFEETDSEDVSSTEANKQVVGVRKGPVAAGRVRLTTEQTDSRASRPGPVTSLKKPTPGLLHTPVRQYVNQRGGAPYTNHTTKKLFDSSTAGSPASDVSTHGALREPLDYVGVTNQTSDGFTLVWDSPEGKYKNFVVTRKESEKDSSQKQREGVSGDVSKGGNEEQQWPEERGKEDENRVPEATEGSMGQLKPTGGSKTFKKEVPGSARSFQFEDLLPKTEYTVTLLGNGPGLLSRLHKLVISTGPEPPTNIVFSKVTDNSVTVSWTKPKSPVSGFKVTYTHAEEGEPVSVSVDSDESSVGLAQLSPGSSYEVTVISTLNLDESDPIRDAVITLPDPPTDLRAFNVTDSTALLLWRPALATVDKYAIVYGSGTDSELRVTVSGNAAEQQLSGLEGSTTYTVTITSQLGDLESSQASTSFTTTDGYRKDGGQVRDLQASNVTPRTATLTWKPPSQPVGRYRLTYQTEGQEMKEVMVDATATQYDLRRLFPGSTYSAQLQAEVGGQFMAAVSTDFTTGTLRFPFPSDCSQELLNGISTSGEVEIFPQGKGGVSTLVFCDMETDGGGWTVFQRRKDGSLDFFKGWKDYVQGFGDPNGEFWLGLESLHNLTTMTRMSLRVDLRSADDAAHAQYSTFEVGKKNFKLTVDGFSGTAGDSLKYHNNRIFSTKDRDPATFITRCAMSYRGGWWYKNCHEANLNGLYGVTDRHQGVIWTAWKGKEFSIPFTEMKMRPTAFRPPSRG